MSTFPFKECPLGPIMPKNFVHKIYYRLSTIFSVPSKPAWFGNVCRWQPIMIGLLMTMAQPQQQQALPCHIEALASYVDFASICTFICTKQH